MVQITTLMAAAALVLGVKALAHPKQDRIDLSQVSIVQELAPSDDYMSDFIKDVDEFFKDVMSASFVSFSAEPSASVSVPELNKRAINEASAAGWNGDLPESVKDIIKSRREAIRSALSASSVADEASIAPELERRGIMGDNLVSEADFGVGDLIGGFIQSEIKQHIESSISDFLEDHKSEIESVRSEIGSTSLNVDVLRSKLSDAASYITASHSSSSSAGPTSSASKPKPTSFFF